MIALKLIWLVAFPIIMLALFLWARKYNKKKVDTAYLAKSVFWSIICDIPFVIWFFD